MRELHDTGYMNNRGRQNVANFLLRRVAQNSLCLIAAYQHAVLLC